MSWWRKEAMAASSARNGQVEQSPNPYVDARRQWHSQVGRAFGAAHAWQIMGMAGLLIGLGGVAGVTYIGSQSKFVPYVIEVNSLVRGSGSSWAGAVGCAGRSARSAGLASLVHRLGPTSHAGRRGPARRYFPGLRHAADKRPCDRGDERVVQRQ
jgi:VirB8 protein